MNKAGKLMGITQAAQLLGVHPLTLRSWAEKGYVPHYRTPGGHRRFRRDELLAFIAKMNQGEPEDAVAVAARQAVREAISTLPEADTSQPVQREKLAVAEQQRQAMRESGQELLRLTIQYVSGAEGNDVLDRARDIGTTYGNFAARHGMSTCETVATFNFFQDTIINATFDSQAIDAANPRLYRRMNRFFNEVLLATVRAVERAK